MPGADTDPHQSRRARFWARRDRGQLLWTLFLNAMVLFAIVIGMARTLLLNLMRVAAVAALEATWGHLPALLFHDYGGTVLVIVWLFAFWFAVQRWILVAPASDDVEPVSA